MGLGINTLRVTTHPRDINRCPAGTLRAQQRRAVGEVCLTA
jgi:hypothetical protein